MPSLRKVFMDDGYIVEVHEDDVKAIGPFKCRLAIKRRHDQFPIRSWRILQNIKNEIVGEDAVAIELYPRESDVTDTANIYHLWVYREGMEPPVGLIPPEQGRPKKQ
jgi:hypothetical protein